MLTTYPTYNYSQRGGAYFIKNAEIDRTQLFVMDDFGNLMLLNWEVNVDQHLDFLINGFAHRDFYYVA